MLRNVCAVWLVSLIVLPFSAPFSACDLATFFPAAEQDATTQPIGPGTPGSLADAATSHALPVARVTARSRGPLKFVAPKFESPVPTTLAPEPHTDRERAARPSVGSSFISPLRI
jgi:hypothetical protein